MREIITSDFVDQCNHNFEELYRIPATPRLEIWIAPRTDDIPGTGTLADPYDGSTKAKLDAILGPLFATDDYPYTTIHFMEGNFESSTIYLRQGWKIKGAGKNLTTIKGVVGSSGTGYVNWLIATANSDYSHQSVEDLTIDCNWEDNVSTYTAGTYAAVNIGGPDCFIKNVRVLHAGSDLSSGSETFALMIAGSSTVPVDRSAITDCEVLDVGPHCTGITIVNFATNLSTGNRIQNNAVFSDGENIGLGTANTEGCIISGNSLVNCGNAIFADTFTQHGTLISGNKIEDSVTGIFLNSVPGVEHVTIVSNSIRASQTCIVLGETTDAIVIADNYLYLAGGSPGFGITASGTHTNLRIFGNTLGEDLTSSISATGKSIQFNRTCDGAIPAGLDDDGLDAAILTTGTLPSGRLPAFSGDASTYAGSTVISIPTASTSTAGKIQLATDVEIQAGTGDKGVGVSGLSAFWTWLKTQAHTWSANQTLDGTANSMPNQIVSSGDHIMNRSATDLRFLDLAGKVKDISLGASTRSATANAAYSLTTGMIALSLTPAAVTGNTADAIIASNINGSPTWGDYIKFFRSFWVYVELGLSANPPSNAILRLWAGEGSSDASPSVEGWGVDLRRNSGGSVFDYRIYGHDGSSLTQGSWTSGTNAAATVKIWAHNVGDGTVPIYIVQGDGGDRPSSPTATITGAPTSENPANVLGARLFGSSSSGNESYARVLKASVYNF